MYPYIRKTKDEYQLQQKMKYGWHVVSACETYKQALQERREYKENQPEIQVRIRIKRIKLGETNNGK